MNLLWKDRVVEKSRNFAEYHHSKINHLRKYTNEPYIEHPREVVEILKPHTNCEMILSAAWLHDTGFVQTIEGHEAASLEIAEEFLSGEGYDRHKIEMVKACILTTKMPQSPHSGGTIVPS